MIDFKAKVKEMCKLKGMQQKELAKKLGISEVGLSTTLGKNNPQLATMENIAAALDVSLVELLSLEPDNQEPRQENIPQQGGQMRCPHCGGNIEIFVKAL